MRLDKIWSEKWSGVSLQPTVGWIFDLGVSSFSWIATICIYLLGTQSKFQQTNAIEVCRDHEITQEGDTVEVIRTESCALFGFWWEIIDEGSLERTFWCFEASTFQLCSQLAGYLNRPSTVALLSGRPGSCSGCWFGGHEPRCQEETCHSGWVDTQKQREHRKQFMILLEPPIILSSYINTMWLGIWSSNALGTTNQPTD